MQGKNRKRIEFQGCTLVGGGGGGGGGLWLRGGGLINMKIFCHISDWLRFKNK